ncbi:hypothetical protein NM208_g3599 [Fusarium decemcellulare]|uniref:Uncharacterized protein n=1 Tax=Fusarium decemcellulare TaxID=57161 RepID=A0ACC1SNN6_9HYPO|nr:hypothetical protein NM208_g3599 [Fusarium decemcellulare]
MIASSRPAFRLWIFAAACISLLLILFTFATDTMRAPLDYANAKVQDYYNSTSTSPTEAPTSSAVVVPEVVPEPPEDELETRNCDDPYRQPGWLYVPHDTKKYRETTWIPYSNDYLNADDPSYAVYPATEELDFNVTGVEEEFLNMAPQSWMAKAVAENKRRHKSLREGKRGTPEVDDFVGMKDEGDLGWLWGRRVVMFSDSVERYMTTFFCEEFGSVISFPVQEVQGRQSVGICEITSFNLTLVYFHSTGSYTYRPDWWWISKIKHVAWEDRWDNLWNPRQRPINGPTGKPDLILWQNGFWDQRAFWESTIAHHKSGQLPKGRQMLWQEVRFVTARLKKIAQRINDEFGQNTPIMFRSLTTHRESGMGDAIIFDHDRISRAIAEQAGHEIFEWGRLITCMGDLYRDQMHPGKGAASWLWGNMVLEYLARSSASQAYGEAREPYFDGWSACHKDLATWGGR